MVVDMKEIGLQVNLSVKELRLIRTEVRSAGSGKVEFSSFSTTSQKET